MVHILVVAEVVVQMAHRVHLVQAAQQELLARLELMVLQVHLV
jgi:hypothetical protein